MDERERIQRYLDSIKARIRQMTPAQLAALRARVEARLAAKGK